MKARSDTDCGHWSRSKKYLVIEVRSIEVRSGTEPKRNGFGPLHGTRSVDLGANISFDLPIHPVSFYWDKTWDVLLK